MSTELSPNDSETAQSDARIPPPKADLLYFGGILYIIVKL